MFSLPLNIIILVMETCGFEFEFCLPIKSLEAFSCCCPEPYAQASALSKNMHRVTHVRSSLAKMTRMKCSSNIKGHELS